MLRSTAKDLAVAVLVGLAFGLSPLTSAHRVLPSILGGCVAGFAYLGWREWKLRNTIAVEDRKPSAAPVPLLTWLALSLSLSIFTPLALDLFPYYTHSIWRNGHGLILPLIIAALVVGTLKSGSEHSSEPAVGNAWGFVPLLIGLSLVILDLGIRTLHLSVLGLVFFLPGLSLLLLGTPVTRRLMLPFSLCLFFLPLPTSLANALLLPNATAAGVEWITQSFGIPVIREGRLLGLPNTSFGVSANCSGFSAFYAGVALTLILRATSRSVPTTILLLLAVWPITVLANTLRTSALILICYQKGIGFLDTPLHGISGIAAFGAVVATVGLLSGTRLNRQVST